MKKSKKRSHPTSDPTWNTETYGCSEKSPFDIEYLRHYNSSEGKDQIIFLYKTRGTDKIQKYRIL
jgi:hypothetical protein